MNPLTHEAGAKKPLLCTSYFFFKNIAISTALGALVGRILKWYTPSHGAIMGAFSGAVGFSAHRIFGNQWAHIQQLTENNANNQARQIEEAGRTLFNIGALGVFAYVAAPLAAKWFQKPTDLRLAFRFHLSSSLIGYFAFSQLKTAFFVGMSANGHGVWLENWAEQEWLTRTPSNLPPVNAKIRWENFTRVPKTIALDEKTPNSTASQWKTLCNKINWGSRNSPFSTIHNALECIDREAVADTTYRYTQNLLAQLYLRLAQEKDPEKQKSNLIFLEEELVHCQSKWLDAIYKTLQNYEKPIAVLQFQDNLPNSTLNQWEELCKTITWGTTNSPFPEIKEAFEELHQTAVLPPKQEGTYRYVTNFMAQLYHKLVGETPLEGGQEGSDRYASNLMAQLYHKLGGEINLEERKRFLLELGSRFETLKELKNGRFTPIHQVLSLYLKERSNQVHSEIEQWALIIDQDIREDLLKHRIPSDFEPRFSNKVFGVHYYEIVKGVLAKEGIFTNPVGVDGHAQYEQAHPGFGEATALLNFGRDPFDDLRKKVTASKSHWIASLKHRYHAEILFEVFKERLNLLFKQDKDRYTDIRLALAQNVRKLLGEDKISLEQAKNLFEEELIDSDEDLCIPTAFKDIGVIFFLQTFGFFEASNEIVPGKSNTQLLNAYAN